MQINYLKYRTYNNPKIKKNIMNNKLMIMEKIIYIIIQYISYGFCLIN